MDPLLAMQAANQFRGPDASGVFIDKKDRWQIGAGVNRLQVLDQDENSNQPMISSCGNYILAFNGEVYNYQDLKNTLIGKGHQFTTHSDTEVVLNWLMEFGIDGIADFKGMFGLAFIKLNTAEVIIARDPRGIKPLFISHTEGQVLISSSLNAIKASKIQKLSISNAAVEDYLAYRHVMGTKTFYNEVESIEPGHVWVIDNSLQSNTMKINSSNQEVSGALKSKLVDATTMVFDAPTQPGLLLSGGVDSTLLLAILRQELGVRGLNTYTLGIGEDQKWAKQAAHQYDSNHIELPITKDVLYRLDDFLKNTDQPIADSGAFTTWLISAEARKNGNVLLSGAGADELFGGYNRHRAYYYHLKNHARTIKAKNLIGKIGLKSILPKSAQQFIKGVDQNPIITYNNFLQNYGIKENRELEKYWLEQNVLIDNMEKALEFDQNHYLVGDVLAITDNATMQNSVETRVPYLYDDIIAHAAATPIVEKMKNRGKGPLKELLRTYGGEKYSRRKKHGFGLPLNNWFRDKETYWLWEFMQNDSPVFEYIAKTDINGILKLHREEKIDCSMQLWSILVLENWLNRSAK